MHARKAAMKLTSYLAKLQGKGVSISLQSCCCKESILVQGSGFASTCTIEQTPDMKGWEITGD